MELNLHIIADDLGIPLTRRRILEASTIRRLRFPALFDGTPTKRGRLYISQTALLTPENVELVNEDSSLVLIGTPSPELLGISCNLIWVDEDTELVTLFSTIVELFSMYSIWEGKMNHALVSKKRLKYLGELSASIIKRPIFLIDSYLQIVFAVVDEDYYDLPSDYSYPEIDNNDPSFAVFALERFKVDASIRRDPFIIEGNASYRMLCQNIFIGDHSVATISFDEVGSSFAERDFALITVLAGMLANGMTYLDEWNTSTPQLVDEQVHRLLSGVPIIFENVDAALRSMAWQVEDAFCCVVAVPRNRLYPIGLLSATAKRICAGVGSLIYSLYEDNIVFIINTDHSTVALEEGIETISEDLGRLEMDIGVSNIFNGFQLLGSHYLLACSAANIGTLHDPKAPYHLFEDSFIDFLIGQTRAKVPLESLVPRSLTQLKRYDQKYGTDLLLTLEVYLKHDMRIAPAARELFLHRNTLANKISRIKFIIRTDFEHDAEARLRILLALRMMQ